MTNIHDTAYEMEKAIRESAEFKDLQAAYENVMSNGTTREMFERFRDTQMQLQEKQMQGQNISEEEVEQARQVVEQVQQNSEISKLMEEEQRLNLIINDVSRIITKPLEELYGMSPE